MYGVNRRKRSGVNEKLFLIVIELPKDAETVSGPILKLNTETWVHVIWKTNIIIKKSKAGPGSLFTV